MPTLRKSELSSIKSILTNEQVIIKRYKLFASEAKEQEFKELYRTAANIHQKHFNTLVSYLK